MAEPESATPLKPITFERHPARYRHWSLSAEGRIARLVMQVTPEQPLRPGYVLKLNSYDLGVDLELADAVRRLRFEHPEVTVLVIESALERVFCAGANIRMLGASSHAHKVNFCKFTNETRLELEDLGASSGIHTIAACNGTTAGGGYELALACDEIHLIDDASSAVSLPEVPLLGVLPGTGGLTRLVDKRKVRRDRADIFCTTAEGIKGERAVAWGLVDAVHPRSKWDEAIGDAAARLAKQGTPRAPAEQAVKLPPLVRRIGEHEVEYEHLRLTLDRARRVATILVQGPAGDPPEGAAAIHAQGAAFWPFAAFRALDDALLHLRLNEPELGLILVQTEGDMARVLAYDEALVAHREHWFVREVTGFIARTLRRLDLTARSLFALAREGSCFAGTLYELALASDRIYAFESAARPVTIATSALNGGAYPMPHGITRLAARFFGEPGRAHQALDAAGEPVGARLAQERGLVTAALDEIDWDDEVRLEIEQRAALSPDALTGMEASLRFPGPETMASRIFGRLSAWQNWIFIRPNATGERGALTTYGKPENPVFDWSRT